METRIRNVTISVNENESKEFIKIYPTLAKFEVLFDCDTEINVLFSDLEDFLKKSISSLINNKSFNNFDVLSKCYLLLSSEIISKNPNLDQLYLILSFSYYNNDVDKIYSFIFNCNDEIKKKILDNFKKNKLLSIVNNILDISVEQMYSLGILSFFDVKDIQNLINSELSIDSMLEFADIVYQEKNNNNVKNIINIEELDKLFVNFLKYINAPQAWLDEYNYLKSNNLIDYNSDRNYFIIENDIRQIHLASDNSINLFIAFVHEFMHDMVCINGNTNFLLEEFSSIYFENIAAKFLLTQGYDEEYVNNCLNFRKKNNVEVCCSLNSYLDTLDYYIKNGSLTDKYIYQKGKETYDEYLEQVRKTKESLKNAGYDYSFLDNTFESYDQEKWYQKFLNGILGHFSANMNLFNGVQYIISYKMVKELINKENSEEITNEMIDITNNLSQYDIASILDILDINSLKHNNRNLELKNSNNN